MGCGCSSSKPPPPSARAETIILPPPSPAKAECPRTDFAHVSTAAQLLRQDFGLGLAQSVVDGMENAAPEEGSSRARSAAASPAPEVQKLNLSWGEPSSDQLTY
ncbi:MAG: hypothetical protein SGPRY_003690 [Prymnesium sp.]